jgi:hypothetical protein
MMVLAGDITIKGPGLRKRLADEGKFQITEHGAELTLKIAEAEKDGINFDAWIKADEESVKIITDARDGEALDDSFYFEMKGKNGRGASFTFSFEQAKALAEIFENYVRAYEAIENLKKPVSAKSSKPVC